MINAKYNVSKRVQLEFSGEQTDIFSSFASADEIFKDECCGVCGCAETKYAVRKVENSKKKAAQFTYYEKVCLNNDCRAKLAFGLHQDTGNTLFPKRKLEDGKWDYKNKGWSRYIKDDVPTDD